MATNTAVSFKDHTGNGNTDSNGKSDAFPIGFVYLAEAEVDVTVGGQLKTLGVNYEFSSATHIKFLSGHVPSNGTAIRFQRDTDISAKKVDFQDGSVLTETDLDTNSDQILFGLQEFTDLVTNDVFTRDGLRTLTGSLIFEGSSDDANETTISIANPTADRTITFPDVSGTVVTTGDTGSVTSTMIDNGTIVDADINSSANINGSKLLNDSVGLTKLGGGALPTDITIASANIVNGTIVNEDIATGTLDGRYYTETELDAGQLDNRYFTETELNAGQLDNRYYTEAEADARFYNLASAEEIQSGETWTSADNKVATTAAIDARLINVVDDVGGFVPVANETSFPTENPDINTPANGGTIVSVQAASTALPNGSNANLNGTTLTITNGRGTGNAVIITGVSATIPQGFGFLVETTSVDHTYAFHRLVPKATEVTTVAANTTQIGTVHTNISDIQAVASKQTEIGRLGTADAVADLAILATTDVVADMAILGTNDVVADMNLLATSDVVADMALLANTDVITDMNLLATTDVIADMNLLAVSDVIADMALLAVSSVITDMDILATSQNVTNMNTLANISSNITTVADISSNVTSVANNQTNITNASNYLNNFLQLYLGEASSNPIVDGLGNAVTEGDLYFNTVDKRVRVFNGSVFQNLAEGAVEVAKFATAAFNSLYTASAGSNSIDLGGLAITGAVFSNEAIAANRVSLGKGSGTFNLGGI